MKYILRGDLFEVLYVEDENCHSAFFNKAEQKWMREGHRLSDAKVGFDESEPEDSPYRYGNYSSFDELTPISKEEAERFIGQPIDEEMIKKLLKF